MAEEAEKSDIPALRLNLVRLVHRHDLPPSEAIAKAKLLEAYVLEGEAPFKGRRT